MVQLCPSILLPFRSPSSSATPDAGLLELIGDVAAAACLQLSSGISASRRQQQLRPPQASRPEADAGPGSSPRPSQSPATTFLSLEEAGLVEMTGLDLHERFLARLTISSLNLLKVIAEQEGRPIGELNAGIVCDWFSRDAERRVADPASAVLQWPAEHGPGW
eukprot:SM000910S24375  [mRNA]  locus=s910:185:834:+ [translate_table: standard]